MKLNWSKVQLDFNDNFSNYYNRSNYKRFLKDMIKYNLEHDIQGHKAIDDKAFDDLDRWLNELDGTLLGDLVADFLRTYQIFTNCD